jgi:hypothetical protein
MEKAKRGLKKQTKKGQAANMMQFLLVMVT